MQELKVHIKTIFILLVLLVALHLNYLLWGVLGFHQANFMPIENFIASILWSVLTISIFGIALLIYFAVYTIIKESRCKNLK